MAYDVHTVTAAGATLIAAATASNKLILAGCDATTTTVTQADAIATVNRPASPLSTTTRCSLEGATDNHVFIRVVFVAGESAGGDAKTLYLFGHSASDTTTEKVLAVISSQDGFHLPETGDVANTFSVLFDITYTVESGAIETIDSSLYATEAEFEALNERAVTTHKLGDPYDGDDQVILGEKTFKQTIKSVQNKALDINLSAYNKGRSLFYTDGSEYEYDVSEGGIGRSGYGFIPYGLIPFFQNGTVVQEPVEGIVVSGDHSSNYIAMKSGASGYTLFPSNINNALSSVESGFTYTRKVSGDHRNGYASMSTNYDGSTNPASVRLDSTETKSSIQQTAQEIKLNAYNFVLGDNGGAIVNLQSAITGGYTFKHEYIGNDQSSSQYTTYKTTISKTDGGSVSGGVTTYSSASYLSSGSYKHVIDAHCNSNYTTISSESSSVGGTIQLKAHSDAHGQNTNTGTFYISTNQAYINVTGDSQYTKANITLSPNSSTGIIFSSYDNTKGNAELKFRYMGLNIDKYVYTLESGTGDPNCEYIIGTPNNVFKHVYAENFSGNAYSASRDDSGNVISSSYPKINNFSIPTGTTNLQILSADSTSSNTIDLSSAIIKTIRSGNDQGIGRLRLGVFRLEVNLSSTGLNLSEGLTYVYGDSTTIAQYGYLSGIRMSGSYVNNTSTPELKNVTTGSDYNTGKWIILNSIHFDANSVIGDWAIVLVLRIE